MRSIKSVELFWNYGEEGPTCREYYSDGHEESYGVEFAGWQGGDGLGANVRDYFAGPDGTYIGPDQDGLYPAFDSAAATARASRDTDNAA